MMAFGFSVFHFFASFSYLFNFYVNFEYQHLEALVTRDRQRHKFKQQKRGGWKWRWHLVSERGEEQMKWGLSSLMGVSMEWQLFPILVTL